MSSAIIRIAPGIVSKSTLLSTSSYLVENFTTFADTPNGREWQAWMDSDLQSGDIVRGLDGSGGKHGYYSGAITFAIMSPYMIWWFYQTIMQAQYVNDVTVHVRDALFDETSLVVKMIFPTSFSDVGSRFNETVWHTVNFPFDTGYILGGAYDNAYDEAYE